MVILFNICLFCYFSKKASENHEKVANKENRWIIFSSRIHWPNKCRRKQRKTIKNGGFIYLTFFAALWHQRVTNKRENREKKDNFQFFSRKILKVTVNFSEWIVAEMMIKQKWVITVTPSHGLIFARLSTQSDSGGATGSSVCENRPPLTLKISWIFSR